MKSGGQLQVRVPQRASSPSNPIHPTIDIIDANLEAPRLKTALLRRLIIEPPAALTPSYTSAMAGDAPAAPTASNEANSNNNTPPSMAEYKKSQQRVRELIEKRRMVERKLVRSFASVSLAIDCLLTDGRSRKSKMASPPKKLPTSKARPAATLSRVSITT